MRSLELVHRLDRETSGVLLLSKKSSALRSLHKQLRERSIEKQYLALVSGQWPAHISSVKAPILKLVSRVGKRQAVISESGKISETRFSVKELFKTATLVKASPVTGRMHQIRLHTMHVGNPIALDNSYGDKDFNAEIVQYGLTRLFLHASSLMFTHPRTGRLMNLEAEPDKQLKNCLETLRLMPH
jgi:23S rRNA pseudouridine955/2504/2580 synthase